MKEATREAAAIKAQAELDARMKSAGAIAKAEHDGKVVYFKEPSRLAIGVAMAKIDSDVIGACEVLFNDAVIMEADWTFFQNDKGAFVGIIGALQRLIPLKKSVFTSL